jgi:hypothetical protein
VYSCRPGVGAKQLIGDSGSVTVICSNVFGFHGSNDRFAREQPDRRLTSMLSRRRWLVLLAIGITALIVGVSATSLAGTKVIVGRQAAPRDRVSMDDVSHGAWDELLKKYVDDHGLVDYAAWKRATADVRKLDEYLATLSRADLARQASRKARLSFWINAYNAVTVKGILREYPTTSIRNHTPKVLGYNIWQDLLLIVGDGQFSLDDIEHKILRKMGEPRIHFAIVCAAVSCPPLRAEAYTVARLDEQLNDNASRFFARTANFGFNQETNSMAVSSILDWFGTDFGRSSADQLRAIADFLPSDAARRAAKEGNVRLIFLEYDWQLNDQRGSL